jgi:hypothetical protein
LADFVEILIEAGASFNTEITVNEADGTAKNLVSYTARSQLRKSYYSTTAVNFTISITEPLNGLIRMSMPSTTTANIRPGRYVYDVEIERNGGENTVERIFEGIATVTPNVTR